MSIKIYTENKYYRTLSLTIPSKISTAMHEGTELSPEYHVCNSILQFCSEIYPPVITV